MTARRCDRLRLAASSSFSAAEIALLDQLLAALRRGADVRLLVRTPEARAIMRKVEAMKLTLVRQHVKRDAAIDELGKPDPARERGR
jgi:phosphatidylserine/phosphatidylglycerophosphate/cardiolipin synthase-like enzyme